MQTAMVIRGGKVTGVAKLTAREIREIVKNQLESYKRLDGRIRAAEQAAEGKGLVYAEGRLLARHEEQLAQVGRMYTAGHREYMHVQKAENLFAGLQGDVPEDDIALEEITDLMIGTRAWGGEAVVWNGIVMPFEEAVKLARRDALSLREEKEQIKWALHELQCFDEIGEFILRRQYVDHQSVDKVRMEVLDEVRANESDPAKREQLVEIPEATYHRWRNAAIKAYGKLVGLC